MVEIKFSTNGYMHIRFDCDYTSRMSVFRALSELNEILFLGKQRDFYWKERGSLAMALQHKAIIFGEIDRKKEESSLAVIPSSVLGISSACLSKKFTGIIFLAHMMNSWILLCLT